MKKKILVIIAAILFISSFSACDDKKQQVKDDNYSLVNYTDTGEGASSMNSKTADIEHSTISSDVTAESEEMSSANNSDTAKTTASNSSKSVSPSSSKSTVSTVSNTVNTITYYYEDEVDTENNTSQTSSEIETDSDVFSEPDTDSDDSSNADVSSAQSDVEEPVTAGSYTAEDIAFYYNGEKIHLGDSIDSVIDIIGEPGDTEGNVYYYNGITVTTSSENGSDAYVDSLQFFLKDFSTEKGITIGAAYEDLVRAYGNSNTVVNDEQRYYVGNEYMYFDIQNNIVANIGYRIDHEVEINSDTD